MFRRLKSRGPGAGAPSPARHTEVLCRAGQVVVEMLLILPVFLTIVFTIMEMGNLAFWVIVLNHATYECARIGAMRAWGTTGAKNVDYEMGQVMTQIIRTARVKGDPKPTLVDPQAHNQNYDLEVTGIYEAPLVFPISNILLAKPKGTGRRTIEAVVRMPIEQPLSQ